MFILDSNTLIYLSRGEERLSDFLWPALEQGEKFCISAITLVEFLSYPGIGEREKLFFADIYEQLEFMDVTYEVAIKAADLRKAFRLKLADSLIAATALVNQAVLISRDKDFKKVKELEVLSL